jgi:hypothetical protein
LCLSSPGYAALDEVVYYKDMFSLPLISKVQTCSSLDLDVSVISPPGSPAVLDQPVVQSRLIAIANNCYSMVVLITVEIDEQIQIFSKVMSFLYFS